MRAMVSLLPGSRVDTAVLKLAHPITEVVARSETKLGLIVDQNFERAPCPQVEAIAVVAL